MLDRAGQYVGNYRLMRLLGRGGFAQVYLGEHRRLGTQAAIKLLATHLIDSDIEQFLVEARTIARLEHSHIIRILDFDFDKAEDLPFLVMSYAPNGTLRQRYPRGTRLPLERVLAYLKQAAGALQYAHDARVVHRDVKPENMLLNRQDEMWLSDFGIAVVAHSSRSQGVEEIIGTVPYMAPEQIQGKPRPASDQYALGITVYEWLCGFPPFRGTTAETALQHLHAVPPSLRERQTDLPPDLEPVIFKALEKDPHQRFASIQEFAAAFEQACQGYLPEPKTTLTLLKPNGSIQHAEQGSLYASPTVPEKLLQKSLQPGRGISRRRAILGAIGLAGLAGVGGGVATWLWSQRALSGPGHTLVTYTGHLSAVASIGWSPDGQRIASGSSDQTVQVWDATTGAHPFIYHGHTTNINWLAWSPRSAANLRIASASGNDFFKGNNVVLVWNAATGTDVVSYQNHILPVRCVGWSPDGQRLASGSEDKTVQVWRASNGDQILSYSEHVGTITAVAWSPAGKYLASASDDNTAQVWDAVSGVRQVTLQHTSQVNALSWSPDGRYLATANGNAFFGGEHTVRIWEAATGKLTFTYQGHKAPVNAVAWSPDGKYLASASAALDKNVQIWEAANGRQALVYREHTLGVTSLAWSPDGHLLASASNDGTVRVWQAL